MSHYYHVDTSHADYNDFVSEAGLTHSKTGNDLSVTLSVSGDEALVKVKNGLMVTPPGLVISVYTTDTLHLFIDSEFYTPKWQPADEA